MYDNWELRGDDHFIFVLLVFLCACNGYFKGAQI